VRPAAGERVVPPAGVARRRRRGGGAGGRRRPGARGAARRPPARRGGALRGGRQLLGDEVSVWGDRLVLSAAQASQDRPVVRLGERAEVILTALHEAALDASREYRDLQEDAHRAVHCLQSLAIYALEHGTASTEAHVRRRLVDDLTGRTDQEVVAAYRARFEPRS
jgi:hypothetical protein